jgi:hypothetical protein
MPATATHHPLLERVRQLMVEVTQHKRAIQRHKDALHEAKAALIEAERQCQALGLSFIPSGSGEGGIHGQHARS